MDRVLVCCEDLFFRVTIEAGIRAEGLMPIAAHRLADLEAVLSSRDAAGGGVFAPEPDGSRLRAAIVDLAARGGEALEVIARLAAARPGISILAFGPHGERETLEAARRAGAFAIPRSRFAHEYQAFIRHIAQGPAADAPGSGPADT